MPAPSVYQLGRALRQLRLERGLGIETLADEVAIHRTYLSRIERGLGNPSWKVLAALADELGVEIEAIAVLAKQQPPSRELPRTG